MQVDTDHWVWQNTLAPELCQQLIEEHFNKGTAIEARLGKGVVNPKVRVANVCWLPDDAHISVLLMNYALRANTYAGWNFYIQSIDSLQLAEYLPGGHYTWHTDTSVMERDEFYTQRKITVVAFLSSPNDYTGGGLELNRDDPVAVPNGQGSVCVFPSEVAHRVVPVTSGVRYSLTGWCRGPAFR